VTAGEGVAPLRTSLIIATYNWKEALGAVLQTVRAQWELPAEVLIADDGSRADTGALVSREASTFPVPLRHVWHADEGFRLGAIRNRAMALATGAYLIQIDGDLLLHPGFVRGHCRFAKMHTYAQGSRAMLDETLTRDYLGMDGVSGRLPSLFSRGVRNRVNAMYIPLLTHLVSGPTDPLTAPTMLLTTSVANPTRGNTRARLQTLRDMAFPPYGLARDGAIAAPGQAAP
jgi:glycosyltransferase involved in cell wall biosynthesis